MNTQYDHCIVNGQIFAELGIELVDTAGDVFCEILNKRLALFRDLDSLGVRIHDTFVKHWKAGDSFDYSQPLDQLRYIQDIMSSVCVEVEANEKWLPPVAEVRAVARGAMDEMRGMVTRNRIRIDAVERLNERQKNAPAHAAHDAEVRNRAIAFEHYSRYV